MNKSSGVYGGGKGSACLVRYKGELVKLNDLEKKNGLKRGLLWQRWNDAGRPMSITDKMLVKPVERQKHYLVDGERYTALQIERNYGVPSSTIATKKFKHGKVSYTSRELLMMAKGTDARRDERAVIWRRGPSEPPPFGSDLTAEQRSALRLMAAW